MFSTVSSAATIARVTLITAVASAGQMTAVKPTSEAASRFAVRIVVTVR